MLKILKQTLLFLFFLSLLLGGGNFLKQQEGSFSMTLSVSAAGIAMPDLPNPFSSNDPLVTSGNEGVDTIAGALWYIVWLIRAVVYGVALIYIVVAALRIIASGGDEGEISKNKNSIIFIMFGLVVILLADTTVTQVFYGGGDWWPLEVFEHIQDATDQGNKELMALVAWWRTILGIIAVLEIITSGIRMIMAVGEEDVTEKERKVIMWVGFGLVLLALNETLVNNVLFNIDGENSDGLPGFSPDLARWVEEIMGLVGYTLQFIGVLAFAMLIYAGFLMLIHLGDEEKVNKAKTIIRNSIIGIIIAFSSYAIVATLVSK